MNKLIEIVKISGVLTAESGLSIGGSKTGIGIDKEDNPVIKNPLTMEPYIPGSTIKGVMRSMFEKYGMAMGAKYPCNCGHSSCTVCKLFGAHMNTKSNSGSPRLLFRDCMLTDEFKNYEMDEIIEQKTETMINRENGMAQNGSLRTRERVAAGTKFNYSISILVYEGDNKNEIIKMVETGLRLIEATGLGGKVSAGYGKVNFGLHDENYKVEKEII